MQRVFIISIIFMRFSDIVFCQKYVTNSSFEDVYSIPIEKGALENAEFWNDMNNQSSVDLYSLKSSNVSLKNGANQEYGVESLMSPIDGNNMIGIYLWYQPYYREYASTKLLNPLYPQLKYKLKASINTGNILSSKRHFLTCNCLQFNFSDTPLIQDAGQRIANINPKIIVDKFNTNGEWVNFEWEFQVEDTSVFLTIGNFLPDSMLIFDTIYKSKDPLSTVLPTLAYFYLDEISIELISNYPLVGQHQYSICKGDTVQLAVVGDSLVTWYELPSAAKIAVNDTSIIVTPKQTTTYRVIGRTDTLDIEIEVLTPPETHFNDTTLCLQQIWSAPTTSFANDSLVITPPLAAITFETAGRYLFTQWKQGCKLQDTVQVHVEDCEVRLEFPNIITPNDDGLNETFKPLYYKGIQEATLEVYNRWGKLVYTTQDVPQGWKPQKQSEGVYYWSCNYTDRNNTSTYLKGTVLLAR